MSFSAEQCVIITNFCFRFLIIFLLSVFGEFAEVLILTGKSDAYNKLICIVCFSPSFVLRYAAAVFANALRLLTSCSCVSST